MDLTQSQFRWQCPFNVTFSRESFSIPSQLGPERVNARPEYTVIQRGAKTAETYQLQETKTVAAHQPQETKTVAAHQPQETKTVAARKPQETKTVTAPKPQETKTVPVHQSKEAKSMAAHPLKEVTAAAHQLKEARTEDGQRHTNGHGPYLDVQSSSS